MLAQRRHEVRARGAEQVPLVLRPRAGSLVVSEECTGHAVEAATAPDKRIFVGLAYAAAPAEIGGWADPTIAEVGAHHTDPLLRSLL